MKIPQRNYDLNSFLEMCKEIFNSGKSLQIFTIFLSGTYKDLLEVLARSGYTIEINSFSENITEVHSRYRFYNMEEHIYYYIVKSPEYENVYLLFSFDALSNLKHVLESVLYSTSVVCNLWLPPQHFDKLKDEILAYKEAYMTYFHGKKLDMSGEKQYKRPSIAKDIKYKGNDAMQALKELRFSYGVMPQVIEIAIASKFQFKIYKSGIYSLTFGDVKEFVDDIVFHSIDMLMDDNKRMNEAKFNVTKINDVEVLSSKQVDFQLSEPFEYEDFHNLIEAMEDSGFGLYNTRLKKGSVIFSSNVVDEGKGNIFALSSDGKNFIASAKYGSSSTSIIKFYEFLVEKIDPFVKVLK